jgi:hypothetical protein
MNNKDINNTTNDCNSSNNDDHDIVTAIIRREIPIGQSDHMKYKMIWNLITAGIKFRVTRSNLLHKITAIRIHYCKTS